MCAIFVLDPLICGAVEAALRRFRQHGTAVPINHVRAAVRLDHPECNLSDVLLNRYIGDQAIRGGFNVNFNSVA